MLVLKSWQMLQNSEILKILKNSYNVYETTVFIEKLKNVEKPQNIYK